MADGQSHHKSPGPETPQDGFIRVFSVLTGGVFAILGAIWTFAQVILYINPFFLVRIPSFARFMLLVVPVVLCLYFYDHFLRRETDGKVHTPFPSLTHKLPTAVLAAFAMLMFLVWTVVLRNWVGASDYSQSTLSLLLLVVFVTPTGFVLGLLTLYLYNYVLRREYDDVSHLSFPLSMHQHPAAVFCSGAIIMLLFFNIALQTASEQEIAQKVLAGRGMDLAPDEVRDQLSILNYSALELFSRTGIALENVFNVLGQAMPYSTDGEAVVLEVIDKIKLTNKANKQDAAYKLLKLLKKFSPIEEEYDPDRKIRITLCDASKEKCREVSRSLLGYAFSRGSSTLITSLMTGDEKAKPLFAGFDPEADPADVYVFDPFYYVVSNEKKFSKSDRESLFSAFKDACLQPSNFARKKFKDALGHLNTPLDEKCIPRSGKPQSDGGDVVGDAKPVYQASATNQETGTHEQAARCHEHVSPIYVAVPPKSWGNSSQNIACITFNVHATAAVQVDRKAIIIEGQTQDEHPVFLKIDCQADGESTPKNVELFLAHKEEVRFKHFAGSWNPGDLSLESEGENLILQANDKC